MAPASSSPAPVEAPVRLWSLDAFRGLSALIVFLSHWHLWSSFPPSSPLGSAVRSTLSFVHDSFTLAAWPVGGHHPAVIAFFVLSGFCIHYPFERRALAGAPPPSWRDYFRRRFFRIAPVYWTAVALGLVFVATETFHPSGSPLLQLHAVATPADIITRLAALSGVYPREVFAGNYILTTVTAEILMYAAYPLFFRAAIQGKWGLLAVIAVALHLAAIPLMSFVTPYWVFNSPLILGIFFYAGAYAAHLVLTRRARFKAVWLLATWAVFLVLKLIPHFYGLNILKQAAWGLVCTLGLVATVLWEQRRPDASHRPIVAVFRWCGDISYSLYAMHTPAIMLAIWTLLHFGVTNYLVQLPVTMAAALIAVLSVHYGIERPFYRPRPEPAPARAS